MHGTKQKVEGHKSHGDAEGGNAAEADETGSRASAPVLLAVPSLAPLLPFPVPLPVFELEGMAALAPGGVRQGSGELVIASALAFLPFPA